MTDSLLFDTVMKSVIGGAIIVMLGVFIAQIVKGVWIARWQYDQVLQMKDAQILELRAEVTRLESKLERAEVMLREASSTINTTLGAAIGRNG